MSDAPQHTTFVSRGRLNGVLRQRPRRWAGRSQPHPAGPRAQRTRRARHRRPYEALYYRARLILGEPLPRPGRFQLRGH